MSNLKLQGYKLVPTKNEYSKEQREELGKHYHPDVIDNDILAELIMLYPYETVDMNGTQVVIDNELMNSVVRSHNAALDDKLKRPLSKIRSYIDGKSADTVDFVPIIKDHKDEVDNTIGFSRGYLEKVNIAGIPCATGKVLIWKIDAKQNIKDELLKHISVGIRENHTLKEISFVNNAALPDAGLLSEPKKYKEIVLTDREVKHKLADMSPMFAQLSEIKIQKDNVKKELQLKEKELQQIKQQIFVENGLYRLLKEGKVLPRDFDDHRYNFNKLESMGQIKATMNILTQTQPLIRLGETFNRNADFNILGEAIMSKDFSAIMNNVTEATKKLNALNSKYRNKNLNKELKLSQPNVEDSDKPDEHESEKAAGNKGAVRTGKKDHEKLSEHKKDHEKHESKHLSEDEYHAKLSTKLSEIEDDANLSEHERAAVTKIKARLMSQDDHDEEIPEDDHIKRYHEKHTKLSEEHEALKSKHEDLENKFHEYTSKVDEFINSSKGEK
jgi:hypothetical protein